MPPYRKSAFQPVYYSSQPYFRLLRPPGRYRVLTPDSAYTAIFPPGQRFLLVRDDSEDSSGQVGQK